MHEFSTRKHPHVWSDPEAEEMPAPFPYLRKVSKRSPSRKFEVWFLLLHVSFLFSCFNPVWGEIKANSQRQILPNATGIKFHPSPLLWPASPDFLHRKFKSLGIQIHLHMFGVFFLFFFISKANFSLPVRLLPFTKRTKLGVLYLILFQCWSYQ